MSDIEVARATVTIVPTMEGAQQTIANELAGSASASSSGAESAGKSIGSKLVSGMGKGLAVAGKATAAAVGAAATGVTAITKSAVESYADYEQLVGGVETLFGESASIVTKNASDAYMSAGMSANDYMETVTSFSASLLQSLGGDTAQAASVADMAVRDMSDNANKMGTDMESIQNAYQGFAKQNYTMLDNLKLGYGGTKEEMERLLEDATAISGVEYDISNLSDVYSAINVIQTQLGITGTTASEASSTISGSLASVSSAWDNLLAGFISGDADMGALIDNLVSTVSTAATNLLPAIEQAMVGISDFVVRLAPIIAEKLPVLLDSVLPALIQATTALVTALAEALPDIIQVLIEYLPEIFTMLIDTIMNLAPMLADLALDLIMTLAQGLTDALPELIPAVVDVIFTIVNKLTEPDTLLQLINVALQLIGALGEGLIKALPKLLILMPMIIANLIGALIKALPSLIDTGGKFISKLGEGIAGAFGKLGQWGGDIIKTIKDAIVAKVEEAKEWGKDLIDSFIKGIKGSIGKVGDAIGSVADTIAGFIHFSEPDVGPLSDFHTYAPDMIDLFTSGLVEGKRKVSATMENILTLPENSVDATGFGGGSTTIPIYLGNELLDTVICKSNQRTALRSGGV